MIALRRPHLSPVVAPLQGTFQGSPQETHPLSVIFVITGEWPLQGLCSFKSKKYDTVRIIYWCSGFIESGLNHTEFRDHSKSTASQQTRTKGQEGVSRHHSSTQHWPWPFSITQFYFLARHCSAKYEIEIKSERPLPEKS